MELDTATKWTQIHSDTKWIIQHKMDNPKSNWTVVTLDALDGIYLDLNAHSHLIQKNSKIFAH